MEADEAKVAEEVKRAQEQNAVGEVWHNTTLKQYEVLVLLAGSSSRSCF